MRNIYELYESLNLYLRTPGEGIEEQFVRDQLRKLEEIMIKQDEKPMLLIKRRGDFLDVFSGIGYNHTLFKIEGSKVSYVSGFKLTNDEFTYLRENYKHV